jgi:hypothetical protein
MHLLMIVVLGLCFLGLFVAWLLTVMPDLPRMILKSTLVAGLMVASISSTFWEYPYDNKQVLVVTENSIRLAPWYGVSQWTNRIIVLYGDPYAEVLHLYDRDHVPYQFRASFGLQIVDPNSLVLADGWIMPPQPYLDEFTSLFLAQRDKLPGLSDEELSLLVGDLSSKVCPPGLKIRLCSASNGSM